MAAEVADQIAHFGSYLRVCVFYQVLKILINISVVNVFIKVF